MERLLKDLGEALNRCSVNVELKPQIKKLLEDATRDIGAFIRPMTHKDEVNLHTLRYDLVLSFFDIPCSFTSKRISEPDYIEDYDFEATKDCYGCKFCYVKVVSGAKWADFYENYNPYSEANPLLRYSRVGETTKYIFCRSPFIRCSKGFYKRERAENLLKRWLANNYSLLKKITEPNINYLKYISQNVASRKTSLCGELYKICQIELINELNKHKRFSMLCNQLIQSHF